MVGFSLFFIHLHRFLTSIMKYYKTIFHITTSDGKTVADPVLLQTVKDVLCAMAAETGYEAFEQQDEQLCSDKLCGYVQQQLYDEEMTTACMASLPFEGIAVTMTTETAEDKNWNEAWENNGFEPIVIDNRCIIHDTHHPCTRDHADMIDITIDARQAFGTGTHDTTHLIVEQLLHMPLQGKRVLDCGCGTGILSIAAAKLGASSVVGYDIDEWSVRNTMHNCDLNHIDHVQAHLGDASVLHQIEGTFDIVLANINRNILLADMPQFKSRMAPAATLILSGFYQEDVPLLCTKAQQLQLNPVITRERNGWCMICLNN